MKKNNCKRPSPLFVLALTALQSLAQSTYEPYTFTTLAGNAGYGNTDGTGSDARFWFSSRVAVDGAGIQRPVSTQRGEAAIKGAAFTPLRRSKLHHL